MRRHVYLLAPSCLPPLEKILTNKELLDARKDSPVHGTTRRLHGEHTAAVLVRKRQNLRAVFSLSFFLSFARREIRDKGKKEELEGDSLVAPPRTGRPEQEASPHVAIVLEVLKRASQGRDASRVRRPRNLADDAPLPVSLEPSRRGLDPLRADAAADALILCSGAVRVCL